MTLFIERPLRSPLTPIVGLLLFLILWVRAMLSWSGDAAAGVLRVFGLEVCLSPVAQLLISGLLVLFDCYMVLRFSTEYGLFDVRTLFSQGLFLTLAGISTFLIPVLSGNIALALMLVALFLLLSTRQEHDATGTYVVSFFLLGCITVLSPKWMLLVPFVLIGCGFIQSLSFRTLIAAVVGLVIPYWIGGALLFVFDAFEQFTIPFTELVTFSPIRYDGLTLDRMVTIILLLFISLPALLHYPVSALSIKEKARICYKFILVIFMSVLLLVVLQPMLFDEFCPLLLLIGCIFCTQMLLSAQGRWVKGYFVTLVVLCLLCITRPLWMDSLIF